VKRKVRTVEAGANDRNRTDDLLITNQPLKNYYLFISNAFRVFAFRPLWAETQRNNQQRIKTRDNFGPFASFFFTARPIIYIYHAVGCVTPAPPRTKLIVPRNLSPPEIYTETHHGKQLTSPGDNHRIRQPAAGRILP
jgi:hypothetical protein